MKTIDHINKSKLPETHNMDGKKCYLDPIREKLIQATPEETVRQHVISYLINDLKVPSRMIKVEERLDTFKVKSNRRADIIILGYDKKNNTFLPVTVIECKAPDVVFTEKEMKQMWHYADMLGCCYCALINGKDIYAQIYDNESNDYKKIVDLPSYKDMLGLKYEIAPAPENYKRLKFKEIPENCHIYEDTGMDTPENILIPAVNLLECLCFTEHKLPVKKYGIFELVKDYGVRYLKYGNSSGGRYYGGYRSFLIKYKRNTEFVSIGFSPCLTGGKDREIDKTLLCVAIDNERVSHHALQMSLDDNVIVDGKKVTFTHHGRIAVSNLGSGKVADLRKLISKKYPSIIDGTKFNLGTLTCNRLWNLDDPEVMAFIENLISYALLRDEYREKLIKEKKQ